MSSPLVTVIIPCYNHELYVRDAVMSVVSQGYENIELVVINDGSMDSTGEVLSSLHDICVARFCRYEYIDKINEGVAVTLNLGLQWSRADFVTVLASDDVMKESKVRVLCSALSVLDDAYGLAFGDAEFIGAEGHLISLDSTGKCCAAGIGFSSFIDFYTRNRLDVRRADALFEYSLLLKGNYLPAMSVLWRKSALLKVGAFTPGVMIEDWDLWLRLARSCSAVYVEESVSYYRWHQNNTVKTMVVKLIDCECYILTRELGFLDGERNLRRFACRKIMSNCAYLLRIGRFDVAFKYLSISVVLVALLGFP
jgi:alpha-1,3-rhamnosyltransferase